MELDELLERLRKGEELWPQLVRAPGALFGAAFCFVSPRGWKERLPRVAEALRKSSSAIPSDVAEQLLRCISEMTVSEPAAKRKRGEKDA